MKVLYEDNHVIAVVKPMGVPVMPDKTSDKSMLDLVKEYIKEKYNKPGNVFIGLVHRLDRPTGGTMVFARTSKGASRISRQIREMQFIKTYMTIVVGKMKEVSGKMECFLIKDKINNKSEVADPDCEGAKKASLSYVVLSEKGGMSLVKIQLETGRHHQIRVQFSDAGYPVLGDVKYGGKKNNRTIALWSHSITFMQPVSGERITVASEPDYCSEPWSLFS